MNGPHGGANESGIVVHDVFALDTFPTLSRASTLTQTVSPRNGFSRSAVRFVREYCLMSSTLSPRSSIPVESSGSVLTITSKETALESLFHCAWSRVESVNGGVLSSLASGLVNVAPRPWLGTAFTTGAALLALAALGAGKMVTFGRLGGVRSLFQVYTAGVGSTLPAPSTARTLNFCRREPNTSTRSGEVQVANGALLNEHWKVEPASVAVNVNAGSRLPTMLPGFASTVSGGVVSTVQVIGCAWTSTLPAGSTAWISRLRVASASPV